MFDIRAKCGQVDFMEMTEMENGNRKYCQVTKDMCIFNKLPNNDNASTMARILFLLKFSPFH